MSSVPRDTYHVNLSSRRCIFLFLFLRNVGALKQYVLKVLGCDTLVALGSQSKLGPFLALCCDLQRIIAHCDICKRFYLYRKLAVQALEDSPNIR